MKKIMISLSIIYYLPSLLYSQAGMDLKVLDVTIKPDNPKVGDALIISYKVHNAGSKAVAKETYSVSLKINGELVSFDEETESLEPGESISYSKAPGTYHKKIDKKGNYRWIITIKTNFKDAHPDNNIQEGIIMVK